MHQKPQLEVYEPDLVGLSELKALKEKILQKSKQSEDSEKVSNLLISASKTQLLDSAKKPNIKKSLESKKSESIIKPVSKPKKPQIAEDTIDYSGHFESFYDIFAGNKISKDFNPLMALREVYTIFKEFSILLDSPEFDVHRKFKLALAPLEVNPRDLIKGETVTPCFITDKEMYYRVVKARPEVYDIVSRGFNKKRG